MTCNYDHTLCIVNMLHVNVLHCGCVTCECVTLWVCYM